MKGCRPFTDTEVERITASFAGRYAARDRTLFILGLKTGFRISEMLSLRVENVASTNGKASQPSLPGFPTQHCRIFNEVSVPRRHMKGSIEGRTVVLHSKAKAALNEWIGELLALGYTAKGTPLFLSQIGHCGKTPSSGLRAISRIQAHRILRAAYEACEINGSIGTHCMRKTFADRVYNALGHSLIKTQRALGHRSMASTVLYLSFREEDIDEAILST